MAEHLEAEGWRVCARNWRGGGAELDLVIERAGCVRFVEVKARPPGDDSALDAITADKRRRLVRGAEAWLAEHGAPAVEAAFLVAVVTTGGRWTIEWWDDAFDA